MSSPPTSGAVAEYVRILTIVVMAVVGLSLLTGCSRGNRSLESSSASADAPASAPASTSASVPTPTVYVPASEKAPAKNVQVPRMHEVAKQQTKEGGEAFAKYFIEELNYMVETNVPTRVEALASGACEFCRVEIDFANFAAEQNQWAIGGKYEFACARTDLEKSDDGNVGGIVVFSRAAGSYVDELGPLNEVAAQNTEQWYLQLTPVNSGWKAFQFGPAS